MKDRNEDRRTHLFLELWVPPREFVKYVAREILEARGGECSQFLSSLVPLWMEIFSNG